MKMKSLIMSFITSLDLERKMGQQQLKKILKRVKMMLQTSMPEDKLQHSSLDKSTCKSYQQTE